MGFLFLRKIGMKDEPLCGTRGECRVIARCVRVIGYDPRALRAINWLPVASCRWSFAKHQPFTIFSRRQIRTMFRTEQPELCAETDSDHQNKAFRGKRTTFTIAHLLSDCSQKCGALISAKLGGCFRCM